MISLRLGWGGRVLMGVWVLSLFLISTVSAQEKGNYICNQTYGLCTSAPCVPDPRDPKNKSICECTVEVGKSFGNNTCEARKPRKLPDGTQAITSNYSFEQAATTQVLLCDSGNPWSYCLDRPCIVDPMNTKRAICTCDIVRKDTFITFGGSCDKGSCGLAYWSGATLKAYESASKLLVKELGLSSIPTKNCPAH